MTENSYSAVIIIKFTEKCLRQTTGEQKGVTATMNHIKHPDDRERRNKPSQLPSAVTTRVIPDCPSEVSADLKPLWMDLWSSPVAQLLDPVSDYAAVKRLFILYSLFDAVLTEGNISMITKLSTEIRMLESTLGFSPRARLALGVAVQNMGGSLDDFLDDGEV